MDLDLARPEIRLSGWRQPNLVVRALILAGLIRIGFAAVSAIPVKSVQVTFWISLALMLTVYYPMYLLLLQWKLKMSRSGVTVPGILWPRRLRWEDIGGFRMVGAGVLRAIAYDRLGSKPGASIDTLVLRRICGADGVLGVRAGPRDAGLADALAEARLQWLGLSTTARVAPEPAATGAGAAAGGIRNVAARLGDRLEARTYWIALSIITAFSVATGLVTFPGFGLGAALAIWTPLSFGRLKDANQPPFWTGVAYLLILAFVGVGLFLKWGLQPSLTMGGYVWLTLAVVLGFARADTGSEAYGRASGGPSEIQPDMPASPRAGDIAS